MREIFLVAVAGAAGTLCRYSVSAIVQRMAGPHFPWGTLTVNTLGCFLFGMIWQLAEGRMVISVETRLIMLTGFMGALTTFSTFAFEVGVVFRENSWMAATTNMTAHLVITFAALAAGLAVGKAL